MATNRAPATVPQGRWDKIVVEIRAYAKVWLRERAHRRMWADAESYEELCALMARFVRGELALCPGHGGEVFPETLEISEALAHANVQGFITTQSQPGRDEPEDNFRQRAVVEGHAPASVLERLVAVTRGTRLVLAAHETYRWGRKYDYSESFAATMWGGRVVTGFGVRLSRRAVVQEWLEIRDHLIREILPMHQVTIHDPEWGPHRLLWERLMLL